MIFELWQHMLLYIELLFDIILEFLNITPSFFVYRGTNSHKPCMTELSWRNQGKLIHNKLHSTKKFTIPLRPSLARFFHVFCDSKTIKEVSIERGEQYWRNTREFYQKWRDFNLENDERRFKSWNFTNEIRISRHEASSDDPASPCLVPVFSRTEATQKETIVFI